MTSQTIYDSADIWAKPQSKSFNNKDLSTAGLKAFFKIAELWSLRADEQIILLGTKRATFYKWKSSPEEASLSRDTLERISYILGIYKSLQILFQDKALADSWIRRVNQSIHFYGKAPIERMLSGNVADLYFMREYLDGQRGGGI